MKSIIAMVSLLALISAQAAVISPKAASVIESRISNQKIALENKVATVNTNDIVQGKVAAVMSNEVEVLLNNAENMLQAISADTGLTSSNIAEKVLEIEAVLNAADLLISEI